MHVSPDPHEKGRWRMFYTGLSRRDRGQIQRIGLAVSDDLYRWRKYPVSWKDERGRHDPPAVLEARRQSCRTDHNDTTALIDEESSFPLKADPRYYEADLANGRKMVSFRDPYFFACDEGNWLLTAGRVNEGPLVRRGCVGLIKEIGENQFEARSPLHCPMLYDDVEVPNLFEMGGQYFLIGSIREDAKIRYWHADGIAGPWRSHHDNVLMPQGNYAGRVCRDETGLLLWCFFTMDRLDRTANNLLPPPKRLVQDETGLLRLKTFECFEDWCQEKVDTRCVRALKPSDEGDHCRAEEHEWKIESTHGFQAFVFDEELESFVLKCRIRLNGKGKCGLVLRVDPETHDGYYLSLDLLKGVAQLRAWGTAHDPHLETMMSFDTLQTSFWLVAKAGEAEISLMAFGSYLELSIDGYIVLSLADQRFSRGFVGPYLETAELEVSDLIVHRMKNPEQMDDHLVGG